MRSVTLSRDHAGSAADAARTAASTSTALPAGTVSRTSSVTELYTGMLRELSAGAHHTPLM